MSFEIPSQIGLAEPLVAAVDNGGTNTQIQLRKGEDILNYVKYDTPQDFDKACAKLHDTVDQMLGGKTLNAAGISVAAEIINGRIVRAGALEEYGWKGKNVQVSFAEALMLKQDLVVVKNDCIMAALAQRIANMKTKGSETGYVETISTGNGGAGFDSKGEIPDEPGHEFLKSGAICGCGKDGHVEAHIGGYGINQKYGYKAEKLPAKFWKEVVEDTVAAHMLLLNRLNDILDFQPATIHLFGSIALKQPYLILPGLHAGLRENKKQIPFLPSIAIATHGDDSGLFGAGDAAIEQIRG